jgi:hypothetical protein
MAHEAHSYRPAYQPLALSLRLDASGKSFYAECTGEIHHIIRDDERKIFGLELEDLRDAAEELMGDRPEPDCVWVKSPAYVPDQDHNDLYQRLGLKDVHVEFKPVRAYVVSSSVAPDVLSSIQYANKTTSDAEVTKNLEKEVTNSVTTSWSNEIGLELSQSIEVEVGLPLVGDATSTTTVSVHSNLTTGKDSNVAVTSKLSDTMTVHVPPGGSGVMEMSASHGKATVEVRFEASVHGDVALNYEHAIEAKDERERREKYHRHHSPRKHHYFRRDVKDILKAANDRARREHPNRRVHSKFEVIAKFEIACVGNTHVEARSSS